LTGWFQAQVPNGFTVQQLEGLVRTAVFKSANAIVGFLLQAAADRIDATYQPKPGQVRKGRETIEAQGIFGVFPINRDYYYHAGKNANSTVSKRDSGICGKSGGVVVTFIY